MNSLRDHLRDVPWEDILKLSASAASKFCEWVQVRIDVYISLIISIRSNLTRLHSFQLLVLMPYSIITFFVCANRTNFQNVNNHFNNYINNRCKRLLESSKLAYATHTKESITSGTFCELLLVFTTKVNLLYLFYSTTGRCCLLHLIKQNCLLKSFLRTLILMTRVSLYLFSF